MGECWSRPVSPFRAFETALYGEWWRRDFEDELRSVSVTPACTDVDDAALALLGIRTVVAEMEGAGKAISDREQRAASPSSSTDSLPDLIPVSDSSDAGSNDSFDANGALLARLEAFELYMRRTRGDGWADEIDHFYYESDGAQSA